MYKMQANLNLFLLLIIVACFSSSVQCQVISSSICTKYVVNGLDCGCQLKNNGNVAGIVSLFSLANNDHKPRFHDTYNKGAEGISYSPCYNFTEPGTPTKGSCKDVAACQTLKSPSQYVPIGLPSPVTYQVNTQKNVQFVYKHLYEQKLRTFTLTLVCNKTATKPVFEALANNGANYFAELSTICACPNGCPSGPGGLSGGSVLLIIFFVLLSVYFIGGIIFMKYVRNAEGFEAIPNVSFWSSLPSLIKEGFAFTFSRCSGGGSDSSYDKI
ncbi:uncharacterized protein TRIADDRAFT_63795 [Trichoplax adhaerens]|uniref:Expressed protein n=1 Tax=Trichoplax adhaerens TaxID=10228 RepID=B3RTA4_TRIAD|nr:expressed protein [Trichoplax adhaerens]EDV26658.1 expressed protein [Trichoplax adhaerens]|eukprot:XP_002110654.1 expressed protein [Trichoplax adhaerens]